METENTTKKGTTQACIQILDRNQKNNKNKWPKTKGRAKKKNTGMLAIHIQPTFLKSKPKYSKKVVGKMFYELTSMPKKICKVDKTLSLWLKDYWGAFFKSGT